MINEKTGLPKLKPLPKNFNLELLQRFDSIANMSDMDLLEAEYVFLNTLERQLFRRFANDCYDSLPDKWIKLFYGYLQQDKDI